MANYQSWGLSWFNSVRNKYLVETLTIISAEGTRVVRGSVIEPESTINSEGIRVRSDKTLFIVNTAQLNGLSLRRGVKINRSGTLFEVIIDKNTPIYYNDPNRIETVIPAREICS
jgi:hypothetical protein